jgi:hypothetical protein
MMSYLIKVINIIRFARYEQKSITKAFRETFIDGKIIIFGSRTDDTKRGT